MKTKDFTLGADPEFLCVLPNQDECDCNFEAESNGEFGIDGSGACFEVRPAPSTNPLQVVHNIHQVFLGQILRGPHLLTYDWHAGSCRNSQPLGGHIHFGFKGMDESTAFSRGHVLDDYVGAISILIEDHAEGKARRKDGGWSTYGGKNDVRMNDWGFEYRTPSSWVTSPYVAASILCLAKTVMHEISEHKFKYLSRTKSISFKDMDTTKLREAFPAIWSDIKSMELYPKHKIYLDFLYFLVTNKLSWFPKSGMKEAWGLVDLNCPMTFSLDLIWKKYQLQPNK